MYFNNGVYVFVVIEIKILEYSLSILLLKIVLIRNFWNTCEQIGSDKQLSYLPVRIISHA